MKEKTGYYTDMDIADAIIERPIKFHVDKARFCIYPPTLGKTLLIRRVMEGIGIDMEHVKANPYLEALRIAEEQRRRVCRIIACHTFYAKCDLMNDDKIERRADFFDKNLDREELAQLFMMTLAITDVSEFIRHLGIDKDRDKFNRVIKAKKSEGCSYNFYARSVYGTLIDHACSRYGWTMDYVLWGISYVNLQMLVADTSANVYLSKEEAKRAGVTPDRDVINGDDPRNSEMIKRMFSD